MIEIIKSKLDESVNFIEQQLDGKRNFNNIFR